MLCNLRFEAVKVTFLINKHLFNEKDFSMNNIKKTIREALYRLVGEELIDEERISNKEAKDMVRKRENFVGSHTYGEDLGGLGKMYVAYSYGEQHPLYLYDSKTETWYYNYDDYILPDGKINIWTRRHLRDLRPTEDVIGKPKQFLNLKIKKFKSKYNIGDNVHTDLEPGEK